MILTMVLPSSIQMVVGSGTVRWVVLQLLAQECKEDGGESISCSTAKQLCCLSCTMSCCCATFHLGMGFNHVLFYLLRLALCLKCFFLQQTICNL